MSKLRRVVYLTNIPAPYREQLHETISQKDGIDYTVIYCSATEPNRQWKFLKGKYKKLYLSATSGKMIHNNIDVVRQLNKLSPDAVISTGFNPTMLYSFLWCLAKQRKFIPFTDGTYDSERQLSVVHRLVRHIVFRFSAAFVGASTGSFKLYESYDIPAAKIFKSCLCIDNEAYYSDKINRKYDLIFSGQLIDRKMPLFFAEVAEKVKAQLGRCRVLILGDGPLKGKLLARLTEQNIDFTYPGFIQPHQLPAYYQQAKVLLFPTLNDPWGIVANEACAAGLPVITCEAAGAAHDLIHHNYNGYILPLDADSWALHICGLLQAPAMLKLFSENAQYKVRGYNHQAAARGLMASVNHALRLT